MHPSWLAAPARAPRRGLDRVDDGLIAGAAAVIAGQMLADLLAIRRRTLLSKSCAAISIPGVQKPHCSALRSRKAACRSAISPLSDNPSMVSTEALSACTASIRQERTISPFTRTVHAPHTPCSQPTCVPVSCRCSRRKSARLRRGRTMRIDALPVDLERDLHVRGHAGTPAARPGRPSSAGNATPQQHLGQMPAHGWRRLLIFRGIKLLLQRRRSIRQDFGRDGDVDQPRCSAGQYRPVADRKERRAEGRRTRSPSTIACAAAPTMA